MSIFRIIFLFSIVLILGNYFNLDFVKSIQENFINIQTDGNISEQVPGVENYKPSRTAAKTIEELEKDIKVFAKALPPNRETDIDALSSIPYAKDDPTSCKKCYNLLPGSPGASQYNYGLSVDCGCNGVTGDLISGKAVCPDSCDDKCGVRYTFNPNEAASQQNFSKSTPEVINLGTQNSIPNHMISQIHLTEPREYVVEPANQAVNESSCYFKSEKTNLEQFFKANPDLFLPEDQNSPNKPYVPYNNAWKESSDCFNNFKYQADQSSPSHFIVNKVR